MDNNDDNLHHNNPFWKAMKKIVNTPMNPAMQIDKKDEKTEIENVGGKTVEFISLFIPEKKIDQYIFTIYIVAPNGTEECKEILLYVNPQSFRTDTANIDKISGKNPLVIPKGYKLKIAIASNNNMPNPGSNFDLCVLNYKIL